MRMKCKVVKNGFTALRARSAAAIHARNAEATDALRDFLRESYLKGDLPIQPDTLALGQSFFRVTSGALGNGADSDYAQRVSSAEAAYTSGDSHWAEHVNRELFGGLPIAYSAAHFAERVAPEEPLAPAPAGSSVGFVGSMLMYMTYWEHGHWNPFTQREEHRPMLESIGVAFAPEYVEYFDNYLRL